LLSFSFVSDPNNNLQFRRRDWMHKVTWKFGERRKN